MPELPEVETVRRGIAGCIPGTRVEEVTLQRHDLRWPIPVDAVMALRGRRCTDVRRRAKYLLLEMDGPGRPVAMIHLGMSGRLFIDTLAPRAAAPDWRPHEHWRMRFGRDQLMRYVDPRRFGALDVSPAADLPLHPLIISLGPEPLGDDFDGAYLFERARRRKVATKVFIMDAKVVVGVGNIYASEACFRARIRPRRRISSLTRKECDALVAAIRSVLADAIEAGGTTLRDYVGVDEGTGYFQRALDVYGRADAPCHRCETAIKQVLQAQRSTYYCPQCQD